ncbi:tail fiber assembly protein [Erwinia rhapontici]|uniref:Tail fiber protein n=1 Tax=Erwinia rhapontici TaxID=55212 RepID=A0ABN6DPJ7_ERWRD|nr:tail fiber assembly protein [Erwinia rhapontici]TDT00608.1 virus tail fiber assembly protein lambda gpK [Erwinia rhapontici]BCQ36683.1 tail fiber protein [Erwinia rhapontici]BCQ41683.1 tail fiber protein [Erwinia rhapontici]BCQ46994.1 tail fiber protein [Erwinia rhapontici]
MTINFSAQDCTFYLSILKLDYDQAGTWPDDAVMVSESVYEDFSRQPPFGKRLAAGKDGLPVWADSLPLAHDELVQAAKMEKESLRSIADSIIIPLQDAIELDIATSGEVASYTAWRKYRLFLNRLDISNPDDIQWPEVPK